MLAITPTKLKAAASGAAYSATLSVSGGKALYTWVVLGLPSGLSASTISGAPSGSGWAKSLPNVTRAPKGRCEDR